MAGGIGVADDCTRHVGDEPGVSGLAAGDPVRHLLRGRRLGLERDGCVVHVVRVNARAPRRIREDSVSNDHGGGHALIVSGLTDPTRGWRRGSGLAEIEVLVVLVVHSQVPLPRHEVDHSAGHRDGVIAEALVVAAQQRDVDRSRRAVSPLVGKSSE